MLERCIGAWEGHCRPVLPAPWLQAGGRAAAVAVWDNTATPLIYSTYFQRCGEQFHRTGITIRSRGTISLQTLCHHRKQSNGEIIQVSIYYHMHIILRGFLNSHCQSTASLCFGPVDTPLYPIRSFETAECCHHRDLYLNREDILLLRQN